MILSPTLTKGYVCTYVDHLSNTVDRRIEYRVLVSITDVTATPYIYPLEDQSHILHNYYLEIQALTPST